MTAEQQLLEDAFQIIKRIDSKQADDFKQEYRKYKYLRDNPIELPIFIGLDKARPGNNRVVRTTHTINKDGYSKKEEIVKPSQCICKGFYQPVHCPIHKREEK